MNTIDQKLIDHRPDFHNFKIIDYGVYYSDCEHAASYNELLYVLNGKVTLHLHPALKGLFLTLQHHESGTLA